MGRVLSAAQIAGYDRDGFVFPVAALSAAEVASLRARFEAFDASAAANDGDGKLHRHYKFKTHLRFDWADEIAPAPRLLDAVEDLIGPDILVWACGVFDKPPGSPAAIPWHQDGIYSGFEGGRAVRAWVALTRTRVANGTMRYLPGSHRAGYLPHRDAIAEANAGSLATRGESIASPVDDAAAVAVEIEPGEASLHAATIVHGSPRNLSDKRRLNIAVTFVTPDTRPAHGPDGALLVRGRDRFGHWALEQRLDRADPDGARRRHAAAMAMRNRVFYRTADSLPAGVTLDD